MNLTEKAIQRLKAGKTRVDYPDDSLVGFGLRITEENRRSFFWHQKIASKHYFKSLGEFPLVTVSDARTKAMEWASIAANWKAGGCPDPNPLLPKRLMRGGVPSFSEMAEAYIAQHVRVTANRPESAEYMVRWRLKKHFADWLTRRVDSITIADVLAVKRDCGKKIYLFNRACQFVKAIYNWAGKSRDGKVNFWRCTNPAADVETYKEEKRERPLTPEEAVKYDETLEKVEHVDLRDFLKLAEMTGRRKSEILSMRWADVQWEAKNWRIPLTKNGKPSDVQLIAEAMEILNRRRAQSPEEEIWVFPGVGKSGHLMDLKKEWAKFRIAAGVPDLHIHDLRHSTGTFLDLAGATQPQIGAALGHASLQSTKRYTHSNDENLRTMRELGWAKREEMKLAAAKRLKKAGKGKKSKLSIVA